MLQAPHRATKWGFVPRGPTENQQLIFEIHDFVLKLTGLVNISFIILALFFGHSVTFSTYKQVSETTFNASFNKTPHSHSSKQKKLTHIKRLSVSAVWLLSICSFLTLKKRNIFHLPSKLFRSFPLHLTSPAVRRELSNDKYVKWQDLTYSPSRKQLKLYVNGVVPQQGFTSRLWERCSDGVVQCVQSA